MTDFYDQGCDLFKAEPELMSIVVWHHVSKVTPDFTEQVDFVSGYYDARRQREGYEREKAKELSYPKR